jgi:hypothetical protein
MAENYKPLPNPEISVVRARSEGAHQALNQKLIGTFKGTEQERHVKLDDQTGNIQQINFIFNYHSAVIHRNTNYYLYTSQCKERQDCGILSWWRYRHINHRSHGLCG